MKAKVCFALFGGREESGSKQTLLLFHGMQSSPGFVEVGTKSTYKMWLKGEEAKSLHTVTFNF